MSLPVKQINPEAASDKVEESREEGKNLKDLARDIVVSYDVRIRTVNEIIEDTQQTISGFKKERDSMSKELREILAKCESLRKKDFNHMMFYIVAMRNKREEQVKKMLEDFRGEEEMVAEKLRSLLKKGEKIRIKDFKKMMLEIKREQEKRIKETGRSITEQVEEMQKEVHTMLNNFKKERQSVAGAWNEALGLICKKRTGERSRKSSEDNLAKNKKYGEETTKEN